MKTAFVAGSSQIEIKNDDSSNMFPKPGEILVGMKSCGICGSDLEKVFGQYGQPSMRLGHEPAGVVLQVGDMSNTCGTNNHNADSINPDGNNDTVNFSPGDRVFAHHHVPCYSCHLCMHGQETMCPKYYETNLSPCGLSEQFIVPAWNVSHGGVLKLPDSVTFAQAAMIEPLACCVRAWNKINHHHGDSVAVFGVGPTGILHVMLSVMYGSANTLCTDLNDYRLEFASKMGATDTIHSDDSALQDKMHSQNDGLGVDVSIVATSSIAALSDAILATRKGGTVMMFGVPSKGTMLDVDMTDVYSREITILTSYAASDKDTVKALHLIESSQIKVDDLVTHSYKLRDSQRAFEHARSANDAMKIIITGD